MNDKEKADLAFLSMEPPKNYETWKNIGISYEAAGGDHDTFLSWCSHDPEKYDEPLPASSSSMWTRAVGSRRARSSGMRRTQVERARRPYKRSALHGLRRPGPLRIAVLGTGDQANRGQAFYLHFCCLREANSRSVTFSSSGLQSL